MDGQKSSKEIKVELLGYLGTLADKLNFLKKTNNPKYFLTIFNSLFKDPLFKDASGVDEGTVFTQMISNPLCPREIVLAVLKMPPFPDKNILYHNHFLTPAELTKKCSNTVATVKKQLKLKMGLNQEQLDTLIALAKNPNLPKKDRIKIESLCELLSSRHYDDGLMAQCVLFTQRASWLSKQFAAFIKTGANNLTVLMNMTLNPLAQDHIIDYAARECYTMDQARVIAQHPQISVQSLEILKSRFPKMNDFILQQISAQLDPDD